MEHTVPAEDPVKEAISMDLKQCYECAKKHVARAQILFEEYHTGYPQHIKNLMLSLKVAEADVKKAFLKWQRVQAHLDMSANELLGNEANSPTMDTRHLEVARKIREVRIDLNTDPLYVPDFNSLLVAIQLLEYAEI